MSIHGDGELSPLGGISGKPDTLRHTRFGTKRTSVAAAVESLFSPICPGFGLRSPNGIDAGPGNCGVRVALGRLGEASYNRDVCLLAVFPLPLPSDPRSASHRISLLQM